MSQASFYMVLKLNHIVNYTGKERNHNSDLVQLYFEQFVKSRLQINPQFFALESATNPCSTNFM